jgi:hypothetical protein
MAPWLDILIFKAPKHVWKTLERVAIAMFTTRATVPLGAMVAICWIVNKLSSDDLKSLIEHTIDAAWFAVLGWFMFAASMILGIVAFRWREGIFRRELDRIEGVKNRALLGQLEIKFPPNPPES